MKGLDADLGIEGALDGTIDTTHASRADLFEDLVLAGDRRSGRQASVLDHLDGRATVLTNDLPFRKRSATSRALHQYAPPRRNTIRPQFPSSLYSSCPEKTL